MHFPALGLRAMTLVLALGLGVSQTGCIKRTLLNGQAKATREGAEALRELGDYDVARGAAQSGLAQLEGMHRLGPDNLDVLYMLTSSWTQYGFAFSQDDMESAEEGSPAYEDAKARATYAYGRGVKYGNELLALRADGFEQARHSEKELVAWLKNNFDSKDDAPNLFWAGYAWLARASLLRDKPELVAELYIGVNLVQRSIELDPEFFNSNGYTALASYHARAKMAEPAEAKRLFDIVLKKTGHKSLLVQVSYAERYACAMGDRALYDQMINEVLDFPLDSAPENRLQNTVAVRRARRATKKEALETCGFDATKPVVKKKDGTESGDLSMDDFMKAGGDEKKPEPPKEATPPAPPPDAPKEATPPGKPPKLPPGAPKPAAPPGAPKPPPPPPGGTKPAPKKPGVPAAIDDRK